MKRALLLLFLLVPFILWRAPAPGLDSRYPIAQILGPIIGDTPVSLSYTPFLSSYTAGTLNSYHSDWCWGGYFQVKAGRTVTIQQLGRWVLSGNSGTHRVNLLQGVSPNAIWGTVDINTSGKAAGQFAYVALSTPKTLYETQSFYVLSRESVDSYYNANGTLGKNETDITLVKAANGTWDGTNCQYWTAESGVSIHVPINFTYSTP